MHYFKVFIHTRTILLLVIATCIFSKNSIASSSDTQRNLVYNARNSVNRPTVTQPQIAQPIIEPTITQPTVSVTVPVITPINSTPAVTPVITVPSQPNQGEQQTTASGTPPQTNPVITPTPVTATPVNAPVVTVPNQTSQNAQQFTIPTPTAKATVVTPTVNTNTPSNPQVNVTPVTIPTARTTTQIAIPVITPVIAAPQAPQVTVSVATPGAGSAAQGKTQILSLNDQLALLYAQMQNAQGKTFDANTNASFGAQLVAIFNQTVETHSYIIQVLQAAAGTPLLNADQQQYVLNTLIPNIDQIDATTKPIAAAVAVVTAGGTTSKKAAAQSRSPGKNAAAHQKTTPGGKKKKKVAGTVTQPATATAAPATTKTPKSKKSKKSAQVAAQAPQNVAANIAIPVISTTGTVVQSASQTSNKSPGGKKKKKTKAIVVNPPAPA